MTYTVCPNCGQKALTVATRCPHCGVPFEAQFFRHSATVPKRKRIPRGLILAGAAVTVLGVNAVRLLITNTPDPTPAARPVVPAPLAEPAPQPRDASPLPAADSLGAAPTPSPEFQGDSLPLSPDGASSSVSSAPEAGDTVGTRAGQRRYASTWLNVRAGRSGTAPVLRILYPGEAVQVDSPQQGWYRIVSGQEPPGYVDRSLLDSLPASALP